MLAVALNQYWAESFPVVCVGLILDSRNYSSGEQDPTAQHPFPNVCPYGFTE